MQFIRTHVSKVLRSETQRHGATTRQVSVPLACSTTRLLLSPPAASVSWRARALDSQPARDRKKATGTTLKKEGTLGPPDDKWGLQKREGHDTSWFCRTSPLMQVKSETSVGQVCKMFTYFKPSSPRCILRLPDLREGRRTRSLIKESYSDKTVAKLSYLGIVWQA